jgi:hypothetical protein
MSPGRDDDERAYGVLSDPTLAALGAAYARLTQIEDVIEALQRRLRRGEARTGVGRRCRRRPRS